MSDRDREVGEVVAELRGGLTQQTVADGMRERGWKWSQATVWSVEKGERPLRLVEAQDLALVLGVETDALLQAPESAAADRRIIEAAREVREAYDRAVMNLRSMLGGQVVLEEALASKTHYSPEVAAAFDKAVSYTAMGAAKEAEAAHAEIEAMARGTGSTDKESD